MSEPVIPTVTVEDIPVPYWARAVIRSAGSRFHHPQCILAVWAHFPVWVLPSPLEWEDIWLTVDDARTDSAATSSGSMIVAGFPAGRRTFVVQRDIFATKDVTEPVTLDLHPGTVVLVDVWPVNYRALRWLSPKAPCVTFRVLPSGFAHNGRWGERWSQRLGWTHQDDRSAQTLGGQDWAEVSSPVETPAFRFADRPPVQQLDGLRQDTVGLWPVAPDAERIVPTVTAEDTPVPDWVDKAVRRAKQEPPDEPYRWPAVHPECVFAVRIPYSRPWAARDLGNVIGVGILVDGEPSGYALNSPLVSLAAVGITAGRHTIHLFVPGEWFDRIEPVTFDIAAGSVVLLEIRPPNRHGLRWLGNPLPSVSYRILQPGACQAFFQRLDELE